MQWSNTVLEDLLIVTLKFGLPLMKILYALLPERSIMSKELQKVLMILDILTMKILGKTTAVSDVIDT